MSDTVFVQARAALDRGDLPGLTALLDAHPEVVHHRCFEGEWYESGYFAGASLLHHVAGNPDRCPLPPNILEITRLLLDRGADPNAGCGVPDNEWPTAGLVLTSRQASETALALPLLDILIEAGAEVDLHADVLSGPLWNAAPGTAEALVRRGAPMDLRHAAGLGRLDVLNDQLTLDPDPELLEEALIYACVRGELDSARLLVRHGARGDHLGQHGPATALHEAANRGHLDIVELLLANGADTTVKDRRWGGTAENWAEHGHPDKLPAMRALFGKR